MMAIFEREREHGHTLNSPQSHSRTHRRNRVFLLGVQVFLKVGKAKYLVSQSDICGADTNTCTTKGHLLCSLQIQVHQHSTGCGC